MLNSSSPTVRVNPINKTVESIEGYYALGTSPSLAAAAMNGYFYQ